MTIVQNRIVRTVGLFYLVQGLRNQVGPDAEPRDERQSLLKEVESPERRKLIQHQEQFASCRVRLFFCQPSSDLVE